jgi:hypothetical protein
MLSLSESSERHCSGLDLENRDEWRSVNVTTFDFEFRSQSILDRHMHEQLLNTLPVHLSESSLGAVEDVLDP